MKKETLDKLLEIIKHTIQESDTDKSKWLVSFFTKQYENNLKLDELLKELD